jgi:hypothetical protein
LYVPAGYLTGRRSCGCNNWFQFQAEKEEKRLRRVLANRESARQTILRRQVMSISIHLRATAWMIQC